MVVGGVLLPTGLLLMGTIHYTTPLLTVSLYMLILGTGVGMLMQNLVLAVQNVVPASQLGAASSNVAFFRTMGGAIGVSALGALLGNRIADLLPERLAAAGVPVSALGGGSGDLPEVRLLPPAVRDVVQSTYSDGIAEVFLVAAPIALIALIALFFLREVPLSTRTAGQQFAQELADAEAPEESVPAERARETASAMVGAGPAAHRSGPVA